jgi:phage host-nuclease inhibitor protein Gam
METIIGFVAGYLAGTRDGREGLERLRRSLDSIRTSPEVRKMAAEALHAAEAVARGVAGRGAASGVTDMVLRRAADALGRDRSRAA